MQQVRIDFDNPGLPQSLGVVEGESQSRIFQAALYKSGAAYTAPAGAVYSIMYRGFGPQNQGWYDTIEDGAGKRAACTVSGNVVTCELPRQALRVPGHLTVVLCVSDAKGYMLKSWPIMADVRNDGYEDTEESEMYFNLSGLAGNYLTQLEKAMADAEATKNNLTATSAQAQKDIDAKAAAALESIPEEYTELDGSVKQLKEDLDGLESETKNIFNPRWLLNATGWTRNGNSYTGTAGNLGIAYKENNYPISFEPNTKYTISLNAKNDGAVTTDGYGIQFEFYYTDGRVGTLSLLNNSITETNYIYGTDSSKSVSYMRIRHSTGGNNTWTLSEIQIEKGNRTNYVNPFTANDIIAREKIEALETKTNSLEENTEIEMSEVKYGLDDLAVQSSNLIIAIGIDNVKNKGFHVTTDDGYNAFPFIGTVNNKLVCVYSIGESHANNTNDDIFTKTSTNGVVWSNPKKIISTENVRDTITGLGHDSLGVIYFWDRKGTPVNADCSFDLYKTSNGINFTKKSSPVFDIKPSHIGDAFHIPTVGVISFYNTYRAKRNSYGYVLTKDGGETWSQVEIANPSTQSDTPTEISGTYIGDGKILALGRSEDSAAMFQIQSSDFGKTWETKITNITDVYLSTPTLIYDDDGYITVYYYNRADGKLKKRKAIASTVFESATSWGEPSNIASGSVGQDAGNANSVKFNNNIIVVYYSGTDTETSVIDVIN